MSDEGANEAVLLATELTVAWLGNHNTRVSADDVPAFLSTIYQTVSALAGATTSTDSNTEPSETFTPAVSSRKSLASKDHIISMIDGKPYRTLRRHLTTHGLTPDAYRARYNLKQDYPMVAENYSAARREMATKIGLGRKRQTASAAAAPETEAPSTEGVSEAKPARRRSSKSKT